MAKIEERHTKDGRKRFYVSIRRRGCPPVYGTFERKTDARAWVAKIEDELRTGRYFEHAEADRHTFREAAERYIREIMPKKKLRSRATDTSRLMWWVSVFGDYRLADITTPSIEAMKKFRRA